MAITREQQERFVKLTVDGLVVETGMPAIGFAIIKAGLIDKAGLKRMVKKGMIKVVRVSAGKGHVVAYYTDDAIPPLIADKGEDALESEIGELEDHQPPGASEEHE